MSEEVHRLAVSTAEAASLLSLHPQHLKKLRLRGEGPPCFRIGRRVLYLVTDLKAYLLAREQVVSRG